MIPLRDNLPHRRTPWMTWALAGIAIAFFGHELRLEVTGQLRPFLETWGLQPAPIQGIWADLGRSPNPALGVALVFSLLQGVTALFLHASFSQLLGNLLFLMVFGPSVEERLGPGRFLGLYLLGGWVTSLGQVAFNQSPDSLFIGANGAIAAILGIYGVWFASARIDALLPLIVAFIPVQLPAWFFGLWWFVQQIFYGLGRLGDLGNANPVDTAYWMQILGLGVGVIWGILGRSPAIAAPPPSES